MSADDDLAPDPFELAGTTIENKYRVASVVGDGGFGVVYRGVHKGFGELIAIKCLKLPAAMKESEREHFLDQLREEGRILHKLSRATPSIVQALDVGAFTTAKGVWVPYLVLEWLEGKTLADVLRERRESGKGGFGLREAARILEPAAKALAIAHAQKVAHRDVKPANMFVTDVGGQRTLKLLDFGIAKVLSEYPSFTEALAATRAGPSAFTPRYGAPEQFNKQRGASGPWTDVFALALIFIEMASGERALEGDDPTQLYVAAADPSIRPSLAARGVEAPASVERVLSRALAVDPRARYADVESFWSELTQALAEADETVRDDALLPAASSPESARSKAPTLPVESMPARDSRPRASDRSRSLRNDDPMAETPREARDRGGRGGARASSSGTRVSPGSTGLRDDTMAPSTKTKGRPLWPVFVAALVVGGAATGYLARVGFFGGKKPAPTASPSATASSTASSAPPPIASVTASASASVSAAPVALPPPPADMVYLPPSTTRFKDGSREIVLTRGFYLDKTEVTTRAYLACVDKRLCSPADAITAAPEHAPNLADDAGAGEPGEDHASDYAKAWTERCNARRKAVDDPINCVDFASAKTYCRSVGKRLPTEAEWEVAARGAEGRVFPWTDDDVVPCEGACFARNTECPPSAGGSVGTCKVGSHKADRVSPGLYDLAGNVSEWVDDTFSDKLPAGTDPRAKGGTHQIVRGGSFLSERIEVTLTHRAGVRADVAHVKIGFRCAKDLPLPSR
jgi:serine/threonine protein kinase